MSDLISEETRFVVLTDAHKEHTVSVSAMFFREDDSYPTPAVFTAKLTGTYNADGFKEWTDVQLSRELSDLESFLDQMKQEVMEVQYCFEHERDYGRFDRITGHTHRTYVCPVSIELSI